MQEFLQEIAPDYYRSARLLIVREGVPRRGRGDRTDPAYSLWRLLIPPMETP
jgi:hypothetical protein